MTIAAARPFFPEESLPHILHQIAEVLRGGRLILGQQTRALEKEWADCVGTKHAVALSSCTAALEIAYRFYSVRDGEVIIPTNTFVATANAALNAGARPVFCDINAEDYCIDLDDALSKISPRTRAVVVVHIAGFIPQGIQRLVETCKSRGIPLIEDCAHAQGASFAGKAAGSLADAGCFSLYPTKILTCGVGGVLTTESDDLAAFARSLRHHGQGDSLEEIVHAGNDWIMDEVRAVLARDQLARLEDFLAQRRAIADRYKKLLANDSRILLPRVSQDCNPAYYKFPITFQKGINARQVRAELTATHGIETGALYNPPCHLMPVFRRTLQTGPNMFACAEDILARQLCLPMHAALTLTDVDRVVEALDSVLQKENVA